MRARAAGRNRGPKVIQHVTMEAKALAGGKADYPNAGALVLRQQRAANAWVRGLALALELGSDVCRPLRLFLFIRGPIAPAQRPANASNLAYLIACLNKLVPSQSLVHAHQRQFARRVS